MRRIFHHETNAHEEWLEVNEDETVTYHIENSGWPMMKSGINDRETSMTAAEAKAKWPAYCQEIDTAVQEIRRARHTK